MFSYITGHRPTAPYVALVAIASLLSRSTGRRIECAIAGADACATAGFGTDSVCAVVASPESISAPDAADIDAVAKRTGEVRRHCPHRPFKAHQFKPRQFKQLRFRRHRRQPTMPSSIACNQPTTEWN